MKNAFIFDNLIFIILFIGNKKIEDYNYYLKLVYYAIIIYNIYGLLCSLKLNIKSAPYIPIFFIVISSILYYYTYHYIYLITPKNYIYFYYIFYPNFFKAILILFTHTFIVSKLFTGICYQKKENKKNCEFSSFSEVIILNGKHKEEDTSEPKKNYYFLCFYVNYFFHHKKNFIIFFLSLIIIIALQFGVFLFRFKVWVYFFDKRKTLPIGTAKNTTYFIAATIHNMEKTIDDYLIEMKKLINYLGKDNVIISFMENEDSTDKTREKLTDFISYLNESEIVHRIILEHEIDDPRKNDTDPEQSFQDNFLSNLRIKFYSELRNRCLDFLYEIPNLNFSNTKIIFFNDIIFKYEDIINLLSTNNEDYDAVCGLDFYDCFYDSWVSIDLSGYSLRHDFPYFVNKEGQELVINHKPIRVFSCWNGVMAFTAEPLKDKKIQFRYELNPDREVQYFINADQQFNYESECTYFHIDLYSLGYQKKFINPDVRVAYEYKYYHLQKMYFPNKKEEDAYKSMYEEGNAMPRNKDMSNYKDEKLPLKGDLYKFYLSNILKTK